jgi:hypothetical protein
MVHEGYNQLLTKAPQGYQVSGLTLHSRGNTWGSMAANHSFSLTEDERIRFPGVPPSEQVIAEMAKRTDTVMLAFSTGKDAIATWLAIRPHFKRIIPFYRFMVDGLEFIERSLRYYEEFFGTKIYRVPHSYLYLALDDLVLQPPQNVPVIEAANLYTFTHDEMNEALQEQLGLAVGKTWIAVGNRAADNLTRRRHFKMRGAITESSHTFNPIWDWKENAMLRLFQETGVKMPVDYQMFGRSFDGLSYTYLAPIRKYYPRDYERIRALFPMVEVHFLRKQYGEKHYTEADF